MKTHQNIAQKITTSVSINSALQQALKILQMSNIELNDYLQAQAQENPFLVVEEPLVVPSVETQGISLGEKLNTPTYADDGEDGAAVWEKTLMQPDSVMEKVLSQINMLFVKEAERKIALLMFGLLDERGFFTVEASQFANATNTSEEVVREVLTVLKHKIDPAGLFAADWRESVLLQLGEAEDINLYTLILSNFQDILQGKTAKLLKKIGISQQTLYMALKRIKNTNPFPLEVEEVGSIYVKVPDVIVTKEPNQTWIVQLNQACLPKVVADRAYFSSVKPLCTNGEDKSFVRHSFQQASWLAKAIDQRCQNILKISEVLVKKQTGFLEQGPKLLNPMTLKDIALEAGVHESTVSRAINEKYIQTPQGVFPLKYFFSQSISGSFKDYSSEAIRSQIKELIQSESKPLSDEKISEILNNLGVDIARRTVTKYRESMSIPSSSERRRIKRITAQK